MYGWACRWWGGVGLLTDWLIDGMCLQGHKFGHKWYALYLCVDASNAYSGGVPKVTHCGFAGTLHSCWPVPMLYLRCSLLFVTCR